MWFVHDKISSILPVCNLPIKSSRTQKTGVARDLGQQHHHSTVPHISELLTYKKLDNIKNVTYV